jgi:hypothetical protein
MTRYMFRIPTIHIKQVRSPRQDTDVVTLAVKVGDQAFPPVTKHIGNVSAGQTCTVDLEVGPVEVGATDSVVVSFIVANLGYDQSNEGLGLKVLNTLSDAAAAVLTAYYGHGSAWDTLNKATQWINGIMATNCDGLVAQDRYEMTGADLPQLGGPQTREYPGMSSPTGCGANSDYLVTWDARVVPAGYSQDVLASLPNTRALAGYYGPKDRYQHVISLTADGSVNELFFRGGGQPVGHDVINKYPGAVAVAGYYAPSDGYQHVIIATPDGNLHEQWFAGGGGAAGSDVIANIPNVVALAGYHSPRDGNQHVIAAGADGAVHEVFYPGGGAAPVQNVRARFPNIVGIGAYFCPTDQYEHIIVATRDGTINEVWFGGTDAGGSDTLTKLPGVTAVGAYFSDGDKLQHVLIGDLGGRVHETWFVGGGAVGHDIRADLPSVRALAGYYSPGDGYEHVIASTDTGDLHELYWTP